MKGEIIVALQRNAGEKTTPENPSWREQPNKRQQKSGLLRMTLGSLLQESRTTTVYQFHAQKSDAIFGQGTRCGKAGV
jgi:hypothetical protein